MYTQTIKHVQLTGLVARVDICRRAVCGAALVPDHEIALAPLVLDRILDGMPDN